MTHSINQLSRIPRPDLILFDLDGTLVDSVPDLAWCIDKMLVELNLPQQGDEKVRLWVGNGVKVLVERALAACEVDRPDPDLELRAINLFNDFYSNCIAEYSEVYPGVEECLELIKSRKILTGCVTNKPTRFTLPMLDKLGLEGYFDTVVCGDSVSRMKPDPLPLLTAAERLSISPSRTLMVGDSAGDVAAARRANMGVICMSYGYNRGRDIRLSSPDAVLDSMIELKIFVSG